MADEITEAQLDRYVHTRLRNRVRIYLGIAALIIAAIAYRMVVHGGEIIYPLLALFVGIAAGTIFSRMFNVSWDTEAEKVVSRMDIYGTLVLITYILFEFLGEKLIRHWFSGSEALTIILALAGGAVLGRGLGMSRKMMRVLRENI